ncbi:hypothetical protein NLI96_g11760 [Meripilus lineatus]|uniref:Protein kinase domain-containing protein n=1 Tax=Meripilus lineatus TaxID=2056292 RepID=A0AAD5YD15_9APHY|nr:hypothetical protein NLI96_g11760 [Physisporinus lineatus]
MTTVEEALKIPQPRYTVTRVDDEHILDEFETFWMEHQKWLEEKGYMLRPRYRPGWVPSWDIDNPASRPYWTEDTTVLGQHPLIMDATRISDNAMVSMKRMNDGLEKEIATYFSTEPLASHPRNHCVPVYEVLRVPDAKGKDDEVIIVMPLLRPFDDPRFKSVGEAVEFFRQIFEGLQFIHQCNVAHRDCTYLNIMMDPRPTFPEMFHPGRISRTRDLQSFAKFHTRTSRPTKYYFIDFGLSTKFKAGQDRKVLANCGGDRTVPEFIWHGVKRNYDPFPIDVYYIGNLVREQFLEDDAAKRPTMDEVVSRFHTIMKSLSYFCLRSRLAERYEDEWFVVPIIRGIAHIYRTAIHVCTFRSPIPRPPP